MKKLKYLLLGALAVSLAGALAACSEDGTQTYTFTFNSKGGSAVASLELEEGDTVTRPADPTKAMFTFDDWYADEALSSVYTFGTMPAHDVTVYAKWLPETNVRITYDLMYELGEGDTAVPDSIGMIGSAFQQPAAPTRTGYVFGGWFTDAACSDENRYVFTVYPDENMTLYAKWLPDGAYAFVTYYGNGVALADPIPVEKGTEFSDPAADFFGEDVVTDGWYTNADRVNRYEGGTISRDLNLYTTYYTRGLTFEANAVTGYSGASQQVYVPDLYNGIEITRIGEGAFRDSEVRSILLPAGIAQVDDYAFYGCRYLTAVNLTENVSSVGAYAFADARRLVSYGTLAVSALPEGIFLGCSQLDTVELPEGLTSVGDLAFADCTSLVSLTLPEGVTSVGSQALEDCSSLTQLSLPASLVSLGENALAGCTSLAGVTVAEGNGSFSVEDGNLYCGAQLLRYIAGEETSFTMPQGKTSVAAYAFEDGAALTELVLPASVTDVAPGALAGCTALTSLTLPAAVMEGARLASFFGASAAETSGTYSFYIPASLTSLTLDGSLSMIADYAFYGATGLAQVSGIGAVREIGTGAFAYTAITAYDLPATVTHFGARVFEGCGLTEYAVAAGSASYHVQDGCLYSADGELVAVPAGATQVTVEAGTTRIGDYAFYDSAVSELVIPDTVTSIGFAAFGNMSSLTSLTVPVIGDGADNAYMGYVFGAEMRLETPEESTAGATVYSTLILSRPGRLPVNLTTLHITNSYTDLADMAFAHLSQLSQITFPEGTQIQTYGAFSFYRTAIGEWDFTGATAIGESAFQESALADVNLPGTLGANLGTAAFSQISALERITLGEGITRIAPDLFLTGASEGETGEDGYTYDVRRSGIDHELVIPASVTEIGMQAFLGVGTKEFFSPTYPEDQPDAATHATRNDNFSVVFAQGSALTSIGAYAFSCSGLEEIALPASVETVRQNAFVYNLFLTDVTFGDAQNGSALTELGLYVFGGDEALASVTLYASRVPTMTVSGMDGHIFYETNETFLVYVPEAMVSQYQLAAGWRIVADHIRAIGTEGGNA